MSYTDITSDSVEVFKAVMKQNGVSVIKAGATWCGPCKRIAPEVDKIYLQLSSNIQVYHIDVDECPDIAGLLRIRKLPTFISFVGGDKMDILESSKIDEIQRFFKKVLLRARAVGSTP